jgi:hypothetical protein
MFHVKTLLKGLLGAAIWAGMTLQTTVLAVLEIAFAVLVWWPYAGLQIVFGRRDLGRALGRQAWPLIWLDARRPFAALTMPLWIALWPHLTPHLAYALNTPDDPEPATQGWGGTNHEPQVLWVLNHCGRFWVRVYWLCRNCLYGAAVRSKPTPIDVGQAIYAYSADGWLTARWEPANLVVERITGIKIWPGRVLSFGADVHAYVNKLGPPLERNARPEMDPTRDTGGVPCVKLLRLK